MKQEADNLTENYTVDAVQVAARYGAKIGPTGCALLGYLLGVANAAGEFDARPETVGAIFGLSRATAIRHLDEMCERRLLSKKSNRGTLITRWVLSASCLKLRLSQIEIYQNETKQPVSEDSAAEQSQNETKPVVDTRAPARSNRNPEEEKSKHVGENNDIGKEPEGRKRRRSAPPATPEPVSTADDDALARFEVWLSEQPEDFRVLFEYAAPALSAPYRTVSAKRRAEVAASVRAVYREGCNVEVFKAIRKLYDADPWRDTTTGRKITFTHNVLRNRYAELVARLEPDGSEAGEALESYGDTDNVVTLTPTQIQARKFRAAVERQLAAAREREASDAIAH